MHTLTTQALNFVWSFRYTYLLLKYIAMNHTTRKECYFYSKQKRRNALAYIYIIICGRVKCDKNGSLEFTKQYFFGFFCCGPPSRTYSYICVRGVLMPHACYSCYTLYFVKVFSRRKSIEKITQKSTKKWVVFGRRTQRKRIGRRCRFSRWSCSRKKYVGRSTFNFYAIFNMYICVRCCLFVQLKVWLVGT